MKLNKKIFTALLLAMGFVFHQISPGLFMGMRFDFLLIFMFIALFLDNSLENVIIVGILGGILSALSTTSPGGQIANLIDKLVTSFFIYFLINALKLKTTKFSVGFMGLAGTLLSGSIFLSISVYILGVSLDLGYLLLAVVLPTAVINGFATVILYEIVNKAMKYARVS